MRLVHEFSLKNPFGAAYGEGITPFTKNRLKVIFLVYIKCLTIMDKFYPSLGQV